MYDAKDTENTVEEYCDTCGNKLETQRVFYNGHKICPQCYTIQLNKVQSRKMNYKCPKCGYEEE